MDPESWTEQQRQSWLQSRKLSVKLSEKLENVLLSVITPEVLASRFGCDALVGRGLVEGESGVGQHLFSSVGEGVCVCVCVCVFIKNVCVCVWLFVCVCVCVCVCSKRMVVAGSESWCKPESV